MHDVFYNPKKGLPDEMELITRILIMREFKYTSEEIDNLDASDYDLICVMLPALMNTDFDLMKAAVNQGIWGGK